MMRLSYGTFDPAAQSCPLFFLQLAGLPEARACLSGRVWFFAAVSRLAPACPGDRMMQGAFLLERRSRHDTSAIHLRLCWKCKSEQERNAALAWTPEQVSEKQTHLIQNIQRLSEMADPEFTDFWQLLGYHDAITPEIQRAALTAEVFWPCEIYYHAPKDVRDGLIHALLSTEDSNGASKLMSCLAMQGDDKTMETLLELERHPRPWRKGLYVDPSSYAQIGGWTFDKEGRRTQLNFDTCYPMVKGVSGEASPVRIGRARIGRARKDTCPHCGGRMVDMLVLDGRDERLQFLGLDGVLTATCCPSCVGFLKGPAFNSFTPDGGVEVFPSELFDGAEKADCYVSPELLCQSRGLQSPY